MTERAIDEPHRAASPLELLFDLTFVVAVASITVQLAHGIAEGHAIGQVTPFLQVFFAIWWAWMNFTWFASSYDTDDVPYRLLTMLQMGWLLRLVLAGTGVLPEGSLLPVFIGLAALELAVPRWAERTRPTSW